MWNLNSQIKKKYVVDSVAVSLKLEMKVSLPGCHTRSREYQAKLGYDSFFTVPSYSYSCGLRALIAAVN